MSAGRSGRRCRAATTEVRTCRVLVRMSAASEVDLAALQQVVEPANPVPTIAVGLEQDLMLDRFGIGAAVILAQQIDEQSALLSKPWIKPHLAGLAVQVVQEQHGIVTPVVAERQDGW